MLRKILALASILGICLPAFAQEAPANMKLFLLVGQSNMAGRGKVEPQDQETNPLIFMLNKDRNWVLAKDPVHFDKPNLIGVGLCSQFAREVLKAEPGEPVGLIPCAFGGTSLEQWKPGGELYENAVDRAKFAMRSGTLCAILWHQGEADANGNLRESYPDRFASMIGSMRKELGAEKTPLLVGELGRYRPELAKFNLVLPRLLEKVPNCAIVSSEGLTPNSDNLHFNTVSLRTFGSRYAEAYLKLKAASAAPAPAAEAK